MRSEANLISVRIAEMGDMDWQIEWPGPSPPLRSLREHMMWYDLVTGIYRSAKEAVAAVNEYAEQLAAMTGVTHNVYIDPQPVSVADKEIIRDLRKRRIL